MINGLLLKLKGLIALISHSLKTTLVFWFLILSILPIVAISWYGYAHTVQSVQEMQRNKLTDSATLNIETLKSRFYEAVRDLESWTKLKKLDQETLTTLAQQYDYIYDLFLIDLEGNIHTTVAHESDLGTNLQTGPYSKTRFAECYRKTLSDGKAHFSDLEFYSPSNNVLTGFITQPLRDSSGKMVGVMGLQLNMEVLFGSMSLKSRGLHQYLVGVNGLLRTPYENTDEVLQRRINTEAFWNWYKEHGLHRTFLDTMIEEAILYKGPNGNMVLGEHRSIDLLGVRWAHISEMDESEVMGIPQRLFERLLLFAGFMLVTVIVTAIIIARHIVKPITQISRAGQEYINGNKKVTVALDVKNEIGQFGEVFNAFLEKQSDDEKKLDYLAKKAQKTLDELKEQKYALDAHSIVAITDVKGTITFVNPKFEEITGYSKEELLGKNHRILNSGYHSPEFWKEMYHTVSHGKIWQAEVCNIAKNGDLYWVDTTIVPFMGEDGKPVSYIAIRTDITERKAIQDSLNEALALQKAVFENAGVSIIITDVYGLITGFNAAAEMITGYSANEMIGKQTPAILHKVDEVVQRAQELSEELGEEIEPGFKVFVIKSDYNMPNTHEWTYVHKEGREIPIYLNVTALHEADGTTSGYMGIASDVSLFKEAQHQMRLAKEEAESSARVKAEFLATMSHEIRTPMNGVLGMLGLLEHTKLDETQRHQIKVASNSANSLLGVINDILDFSKVEAGKMELEMIEFNLRDELGEFIEAIAFRAQEKGLELILDTTQLSRTAVITDPGRLRQILINLISNAVKFTHRGEILVKVILEEVDSKTGRLRIDVRDSGVGIAADKIDKLFQSFSQADNSTTRKYGGTGLGLAIVKKICELMDGNVWITSVEGEGSTFHIELGVGLGERSALSIPSVSVADKTVLIVDDNETNRSVLRTQLEMWGMKVYETEDPAIALDYCNVRIVQGHIPPYDVAILDMHMPYIDGADLGEEIRNIDECDAMKMVMMTSLGARNDTQRFAQMGFDAFFAKPTTTNDLLKALKVLFDEGSVLETASSLATLQDGMGEVQWPQNTRLLLVEDNPTNQIVAQGMLEMIGLEADIANNGQEALESMQLAVDIAPYTVILMDCQMPEMDGYSASTAIREGRAGEAYKEIPIIAMTANAMEGDREKCLIAGMSDYVSKPINLGLLKAALIKWLKVTTVILQPSSPKVNEPARFEERHSTLKRWDKADALGRLGGKKELLYKIMQSFVDEANRMMEALEKAVKSGDLANAQLHAHSIKGSSGNVSAQQLQALAKTMEFAAKNGDKRILKEGFLNLEEEMKQVCSLFEKELSAEVKSAVRKKRIDSLQIAIKLQNLKKEIEAGAYIDTEALDIFGDYADEEFTARMGVLKGHIDRFDTPEALALLETVMSGLE